MAAKKTIITVILTLLLVIGAAHSEYIVTTSTNTTANFDKEAQSTLPSSENIIVTNYNVVQDFFFSSDNKNINVCACSVFLDVITIQNIGNVEDNYKISTDKEYSKLTAEFAVLKPGETTEIYNYINPGCKPLEEEITVSVTSSNGKTKEMTQLVNSPVCNNINATPVNTQLESTPCKTSVAHITLQNPLDFQEAYFIGTNILAQHATFSEDQVILMPGQKRDVFVYFNPTCDFYGEYEGTIDVWTKNTQLEIQIPTLVNISQKYEYEIIAQDEYETCNNVYTRVPITIINNENFSNSYAISMNKSKWFKLENKTIDVGPYAQKTFYMHAAPKWKWGGQQDIELKAVSNLGDVEKTKEIKLWVPDCYKFDLSYASWDIVCSDEDKIYFKINNTGTKDMWFNVGYSGPDFGILQPQKYFVKSQEEIYFPLFIVPDDITKKYDIKVNASILNSAFFDEQKVRLKVKSLDDCYKADIDIPRIKVRFNESEFNITVENEGFKTANYEVTLNASKWVSIDKEFLTLEPGEEDVIKLRLAPEEKYLEEGTYLAHLNLTENSKTYYEKEFKIMVTKNTSFLKKYIKILSLLILVPVLAIIILGLLIAGAFSVEKTRKEKRQKLIVKLKK
ncbi:hypothetical protein GOV08_02675 [Candidatus Woesearchaeota archaeon]|nr:hypothetical protein [Candidatus Woesearchaeota archaeon]